MRERIALVIGATGLVGTQLVRQLCGDERFSRVITLGRRPTGQPCDKLEEHVVDFGRPEDYRQPLRGDVLFSALGTTLRAAGSKDAQWRVDHDFQLAVAAAAKENGVDVCVVVSSVGADPGSAFFYPRMKGALEREVAKLDFPRTRFLRPGPLDGERSEKRRGEELSLALLRPLGKVLPAKLRPIRAETVAHAAIAASFDETPGVKVIAPEQLFVLHPRIRD